MTSAELVDYYVCWDGIGVRNEDGSPAFIEPRVANEQEQRWATAVAMVPSKSKGMRRSRAKDRAEWKRRMNSRDLLDLLSRTEGWVTVRDVVNRSGYSYNQARNALYMVAREGLIQAAYRPMAKQRPVCIYATLGTPPEK